MKKKYFKIIIVFFILTFFNSHKVLSDTINQIDISGNYRISDETIKLFSGVEINDNIDKNIINDILKNLYKTNFFKDVSLSFKNNILTVKVVENPIIDNIEYKGIRANKILEALKEGALIKSRSALNETDLKKEKFRLQNILK